MTQKVSKIQKLYFCERLRFYNIHEIVLVHFGRKFFCDPCILIKVLPIYGQNFSAYTRVYTVIGYFCCHLPCCPVATTTLNPLLTSGRYVVVRLCNKKINTGTQASERYVQVVVNSGLAVLIFTFYNFKSYVKKNKLNWKDLRWYNAQEKNFLQNLTFQ
jgi:hypothetical protein